MLRQAGHSVVSQGGSDNYRCQNHEDDENTVGKPPGTAFVRVDVDVRHISADYLGVRDGRGF